MKEGVDRGVNVLLRNHCIWFYTGKRGGPFYVTSLGVSDHLCPFSCSFLLQSLHFKRLLSQPLSLFKLVFYLVPPLLEANLCFPPIPTLSAAPLSWLQRIALVGKFVGPLLQTGHWYMESAGWWGYFKNL